MSVTHYVGTAGTVDIGLETPSAAAIARGFYLGDAGGSLADGPALYVTNVTNAHVPITVARWMHNGMIVTMSSPDVSASRLAALAGTVTVMS